MAKSNKKTTAKNTTPNKAAAKARGRPAKPAGQVRTYTLKIRLTEAERQEIDSAAAGEALETSSWSRAVLLREARRLRAATGRPDPPP